MTFAPAPLRATHAYGQAAATMSPGRQIVLLYDGVVRRLKEARAAGLSGQIEDRFNAVQKAAAIVDALHACLDHDQGGDVAAGLDRFYTYVAFRLQRFNQTGDASICDELIARLGEVRDSWAAIADGPPPPARPAPRGAQLTT